MNRQDAITLMKQGVKMTHDLFDYDEWVSINEDGMYTNEEGVLIPEELYWDSYIIEEAEEGWYRWEVPEEKKSLQLERAEIGTVGLVQETEDGRIAQIGLTPDQSKILQIFLIGLSKESPLVQMGEQYDLILKNGAKK